MYYFYADIADTAIKAINAGIESVTLSCDLNLSVQKFNIKNNVLILDVRTTIDLKQLEKIRKKKSRIYIYDGDQLRPLEIRSEDYYKLVPTNTAPYLEISGVKMHISKGICPFESAGLMAETVVKRGFMVLDTCSGLGYCALRSAKIGAKKTITVEVNSDIMQLRAENPWSAGLYDNSSIEQQHGDIASIISTFATGTFDAIIHDPPRFSLAGELYGVSFYKELNRVLKTRGALFHYTGNPHIAKQGNAFVTGAVNRLLEAGFKKVMPDKHLLGVKALS